MIQRRADTAFEYRRYRWFWLDLGLLAAGRLLGKSRDIRRARWS